MEYAKLTPEERKKYVSLEDVIGKPVSEMGIEDVQKAVDGCPIKPILNWSVAKKNDEYLRQLRIFFQHVTIKRMVHVLFGDVVSNGDLGKKFITLRVKVPTANDRVGKYEFENLVFDKWVSDGRKNEEVVCHNEVAQVVDHDEATQVVDHDETTQVSNEAETTENTSPETGEGIVDYNVATPRTTEDSTNEARGYHLLLEIAGDDPVRLYEIYVEILKLYQNDPRGRVLYNPFMDMDA